MKDQINPSHYAPGDTYETIKVIEAWGLHRSFCLGNVLKYVSRMGKKDPTKSLEDLKKARWYLDREISRREAQEPCEETKTVPTYGGFNVLQHLEDESGHVTGYD